MTWLRSPDNIGWLLIFDNIDWDYSLYGTDSNIYNVEYYFSCADHGVVLIITKLIRLKQLGDSQHLGKVNRSQAEAIFQSWYKK